jgi:hypothetical protein
MACIECRTDNAHAEVDARVGRGSVVRDVCDVRDVNRTITGDVATTVVGSRVRTGVSESRVGAAVLTNPACRRQCEERAETTCGRQPPEFANPLHCYSLRAGLRPSSTVIAGGQTRTPRRQIGGDSWN